VSYSVMQALWRPQGFETQGNEFSYYMLLAAAFVLNHAERRAQWGIHPWALGCCNQPTSADQFREVRGVFFEWELQTSLKAIEQSLSCLACRIGHWDPI
jgi:N2227-like protein